jgi:hypothetical protein
LRIVLRLPFCRHGLSARSALFLARRFPAGAATRSGRSINLDAGQENSGGPRQSRFSPVGLARDTRQTAASKWANPGPTGLWDW